ncbi:MAG: hypothetical protein ACREC0_09405 [Methylocella sp.]
MPELDSFKHATTRNRVLAVGQAIEARIKAEIVAKPIAENPPSTRSARVIHHGFRVIRGSWP